MAFSITARLSRILIVDDVPVNLRALADLLAPHYEVMVATSALDALEAARAAEAPDLILLDIMMPEMDGYQACRRLKADPATQDIPIIFITARNEVEDETLGLDLGAVDYITKPFDGKVVLARVRTHLDLKFRFDTLRRALAERSPRVENLFRKSGDVWAVRYLGGREFYLNDSKGAAYLALLLAHPNRSFKVEDLIFHVSAEAAALTPGDAGDALDDRALRQYKARVDDLRDRQEEAERNNDLATVQRVQQELNWIVDEMKRAGALGRRVRKEASDRERFRKSVGNAIRRVLADIVEADPALAMHLGYPRLRLGYNLVYEPKDDIAWTV